MIVAWFLFGIWVGIGLYIFVKSIAKRVKEGEEAKLKVEDHEYRLFDIEKNISTLANRDRDNSKRIQRANDDIYDLEERIELLVRELEL